MLLGETGRLCSLGSRDNEKTAMIGNPVIKQAKFHRLGYPFSHNHRRGKWCLLEDEFSLQAGHFPLP